MMRDYLGFPMSRLIRVAAGTLRSALGAAQRRQLSCGIRQIPPTFQTEGKLRDKQQQETPLSTWLQAITSSNSK